jgi:hypothetical protein
MSEHRTTDTIANLRRRIAGLEGDRSMYLSVDCESLAALLAVAEAANGIGSWMSAAMDDPAVCAEMKADADRLLSALHKLSQVGAP